jgi:hypothetical protein
MVSAAATAAWSGETDPLLGVCGVSPASNLLRRSLFSLILLQDSMLFLIKLPESVYIVENLIFFFKKHRSVSRKES